MTTMRHGHNVLASKSDFAFAKGRMRQKLLHVATLPCCPPKTALPYEGPLSTLPYRLSQSWSAGGPLPPNSLAPT
jgi:hypothetical protein